VELARVTTADGDEVLGAVALDDVLEEVVGEIRDEASDARRAAPRSVCPSLKRRVATVAARSVARRKPS
jgi:CBS domain containing-hemolysin-like protein